MMRIQRGDHVRVVAGNDKGKDGRVLDLIPDKGQVIVQNINTVFKHLRPSQQNPQGGRIEKEAPLDLSNVMPICMSCNETVRVRTGTVLVERESKPPKRRRYRICKKCGEPLTGEDEKIKDSGKPLEPAGQES